MILAEFVGGPHDGAQAVIKVAVPVFFFKESQSVYRYSRLRPSGVHEYLHASLIRTAPTQPPEIS